MKMVGVKLLLITPTILLLSFCNLLEDLGLTKKKKEGLDFYEQSLLRCHFTPSPPDGICTDSYWRAEGVDTYSGYLELYDSRGKICGGLTKANIWIYKEDGTIVKESAITEVIPLKCKVISTGSSTSSSAPEFQQRKSSWYKLESNTSKKANLAYTHSFQTDTNGKPVDVDSFANYLKGDTLLCCIETIWKDRCNHEYVHIGCNKLGIQ